MSNARWALVLTIGLAACSARYQETPQVDAAQGELALALDLPTGVHALIEVISERGRVVSRRTELASERFVLRRGRYTVRLSAMRHGELIRSCKPAEAGAWVEPASTAQVWLVINCDPIDQGNVVVRASVNYAPVIEDLLFSPARTAETCETTTVTVTAVDREGDAIDYQWELDVLTETSLVDSRGAGPSFSATFHEPGAYPLTVRACDDHGACTSFTTELHVSPGDGACGQIRASAWRIRNANAPSANAWALRGLRFCTDLQCDGYVSGEVFDDGSSRSWSRPESLFDDDPTNFWKAFAAPTPGEAYVGLLLDEPASVVAVGFRPDNVVYGVSWVWVEYLDEWTGRWTVHTLLTDVPRHYGDIDSGGPTYPNDVWYVAPLETP